MEPVISGSIVVMARTLTPSKWNPRRRDNTEVFTNLCRVGDADLRKILTHCNKYLRSSYTMVKTVTGSMSCAGLQGEGTAAMNWTLRSGS